MKDLILILLGDIFGLILVLAILFHNVLSNTFLKVVLWIIAVVLIFLIIFLIVSMIFLLSNDYDNSIIWLKLIFYQYRSLKFHDYTFLKLCYIFSNFR